MKKISVILLTQNRPLLVLDAIKSVLTQDCDNEIELIIGTHGCRFRNS